MGMKSVREESMNNDIKREYIIKVIENLKYEKATGIYGIRTERLKYTRR